jgi:hypothetical protein
VEDENWEELDYYLLACNAVMPANLHTHHPARPQISWEKNDLLAPTTQIL